MRATEGLLDAHGAEHVSLDRVAAEAGVGKGTVFRRFGSRTGLFQALLAERAEALARAIDTPGTALRPGSPPAARPDLDAEFVSHTLLAMFDADLVRNVMARGGVSRLRSSVRALAGALLR
ncbi:helix-turn-helix domain-containing protein [Nonomuraea lactucae]|uniref:helix-turn-helix domain-containing protein n=1 Tax=Nonomuraea lactucae TaxID=2249762 RepID=UPI000DE54F45|nr:TetR/AcrR family transcriptional regulator [Nonomuraea lactucae]